MKELCAHDVNVAAPESPEGEFMFMPGGVHAINCKLNQSIPVQAQVLVNPASAAALNRQLSVLSAKSAHRPYFDFNHEDGPASFWPQEFNWRENPTPGIYAKGEWSDSGKAAITGKSFRGFSPVINVDDLTKTPAQIVCNPDARLNMGGLVNAPAFKKNLPLWCKEASEDSNAQQHNDDNMKKTVAELQASVEALNKTVKELSAKQDKDEATTAELSAKQSELEHTRKDLKIAELEAKQALNNKTLAESTVKNAQKRGVLPTQGKKAEELSAKWIEEITNEPARAALLDALEGPGKGLTEDITGGRRTSGEISAKEGLSRCAKAYGELMAKNVEIGYSGMTVGSKMALARQAAALYKRELSAGDMPGVLAELSAADQVDANLGILSGTLVAQRTVELFRLKFPLLKMITTDFSDIPAALNQTVDTRIIVVPGVQGYDATVNANTGEPNGWSYVTLPVTTDVTIKLDELVGCPIRFGLDVLSSTARRLFDEQAPAAAYAMAKHFVQKIYALLTPANFNAYANVNGQLVPDAYATYAVGLGDFARSSLTKLESIFDPNEMPEDDRFVLLNAKYHAQLGNDPSITQFYAAVRRPEIIEETDLPKMAGFKPIKAPNLTANNATPNLVGFAGHKAGLVIACRPPVDLNQVLPGAQSGSVATIADSELGTAWQLVQVVNQVKGYAQWQLQSLMGASKGDKRGGLCLTSQ